MAQNPSSSSTQYILAITGIYMENDKLEIKNGDELIYSCTLKKNCQSIVISNESLKEGIEYTLTINDEETATFEVASIVTSVGVRGNSMGGMNGNFGKVPSGRENMPESLERREMNFSGDRRRK